MTPHEELTEEQVKEWLKKASYRQINVFVDHNKIIVLLCRALLKAWGKK